MCAVGTARADDDAIVVAPIDVRADAPRAPGPGELTGDDTEHADARRALDAPAFATVVHIDDRAGETTTVAEVLAKSIGVNVRSLGGLGGFSSVSVRGHAAGHTQVSIDGVPVSRVASVTADLGRYQLASFSRVELYRGGVPVELGGAAMGGALDLVTEVGPRPAGDRLRVSAGAGSFAARHLRARWVDGRADGSLGYHLGLGYAGAAGDFAYFNDNGTNLNQSDDVTATRTNNGYDQLDAVSRIRYRRGATTVSAGSRTTAKDQGVPGSASVQSRRTSLATVGQLVDIAVDRGNLFGDPRYSGRAAGWFAGELQRYRDPDGEVGIGTQHRRYRTVSAGARGRVTGALGTSHLASAGLESTVDLYDDTDIINDRARTSGRRLGVAVAVADDWLVADDRVVIQPAIRVDLLYTDPVDDTSSAVVGAMDVAPRTELFPSPRVAGRLRLADGLVSKASAGWYFRAPTLIESFGDRGYVVGNPGLEAETGLSADAGLVFAPAGARGPADRIYLEVVGFVSRTRDTIVQVPTAGLATVALNLGRATVGGGELGGSVRLWRTATVTGNYTFIDSRQSGTMPSYEGKRLPQRPRHQLYGRIDAAHRYAGRVGVVWGDATVTSGNYLDAANLRQVPARLLVGAGVKLEPVAGLLLGVEGKNLTDHRVETVTLSPPPRPDLTQSPRAVADFFGYPLPGRAFYLTVEWTL